jgi:DNA-binding IclR family transcriptional regulator
MGANDQSVRAVERALEILDCFEMSDLQLTLTELAKKINLALSTTSRLVATLEKCDYLARDSSNQKYCLGPRLSLITAHSLSQIDLRKAALPSMTALREKYNESVSLYIPMANKRVCIERVESTQALRRVVNVGDIYPLTRGAAGRVLLAYQPPDVRKRLLKTDSLTNEAGLAKIRETGYTVSVGEREEGLTSIAAPIVNETGKTIAAIAMTGPSIRFKKSELDERIRAVRHYAGVISHVMGSETRPEGRSI